MVHSVRLPAPNGIAGDHPTHNSTNESTTTSSGYEAQPKDANSQESLRNKEREHSQETGQDRGGEEAGVEQRAGEDEEKQDDTPKPVGFFHPSLKHVRREAVAKWILTTAILMAFILGILSIYWGTLFRVEQKLPNLVIYVVDFDGQVAPYNTSGIQPFVGSAIVQLAQQKVNSPVPHLGYEGLSAARFGYDPISVRQAVYDNEAWAAIIVNANATALLYSAVQTGNASYDPMGACQLVYQDARDETAWSNYIYPQIAQLMTEATSMVGQQWTGMVMENATSNNALVQNLAIVPQALSPAIGFSQYNLRPFYPFTAVPAVSIGLIYLIIVSFFSFAFYLPIHMKYLKPEGHAPLKFYQLIIWRWCSTISAYFMLSLAYSLISLAFQINFHGGNPVTSQTEVTSTINGNSNPTAFGYGTFPVYWMLNFLGMIALGLACENVTMFVGQPWTSLWLIFWVITNVSTAFYNIDIEPTFYRWGYAWPLHYIVQGSRMILFDLHSELGLVFGVLVAWGAINTALFPIACWFMRWKSQHHIHEYYK